MSASLRTSFFPQLMPQIKQDHFPDYKDAYHQFPHWNAFFLGGGGGRGGTDDIRKFPSCILRAIIVKHFRTLKGLC